MFEHRLFSLKKWDTLGLRLDICDPGPPSNQMIASLRGSCLIQKIAASPAWKYHSMLNNLVVWNIRRCSTRPEFQIGRTSTTHWGNSSVYQHSELIHPSFLVVAPVMLGVFVIRLERRVKSMLKSRLSCLKVVLITPCSHQRFWTNFLNHFGVYRRRNSCSERFQVLKVFSLKVSLVCLWLLITWTSIHSSFVPWLEMNVCLPSIQPDRRTWTMP